MGAKIDDRQSLADGEPSWEPLAPKFGESLLPERKPYCDAPVPIAIPARRSVKRFVLPVLVDREGNLYTEVVAWRPCRSCAKCRLFRKLQWRERMKFEIDKAERTWFVTLTLSPKARAEMDRIVTSGTGELPDDNTLFKDRCAIVFIWVRDYLKRLRYTIDAEATAKLRFVAVSESHANGYPHMHLLVHTSHQVTYEILRKARWGHGYVDARLADAETAGYLSKYLAKQVGGIKASIGYGNPNTVAKIEDRGEAPNQNGSSEAIERPTTKRKLKRGPRGRAPVADDSGESGERISENDHNVVEKPQNGVLDLLSPGAVERVIEDMTEQVDGQQAMDTECPQNISRHSVTDTPLGGGDNPRERVMEQTEATGSLVATAEPSAPARGTLAFRAKADQEAVALSDPGGARADGPRATEGQQSDRLPKRTRRSNP